MKLRNRVAIITGAGRGIGRAIALAYADEGARVVVADREQELAERTGSELAIHGHKGLALTVDVAQAEDVQRMVQETLGHFSRIDILVNNAGIYVYCTAESCSEQDWDRIMAVNLKGTFLCAQAVIPTMKAQQSGKIINLASVAGKTGGLRSGLPYVVSKAGIIGMTFSLARELGPYGIHVNALAPGIIETDMTRDFSPQLTQNIVLGRFGQPNDVACCAVFLGSTDADFITGEVLDVNGGMHMD